MPAARHLLELPEYRNLISYAGSSSATPMIYLQTILSGARRRTARPADRSAHRHVSPDSQGLAVPERCRGGRDAVRLRAGVAPSDAAAARLGAADGDRGQPRGPPQDPHRLVRAIVARDARRARPAAAAGDRGAGQHPRRRRHVRVSRARPERAADHPRRDLGDGPPQPVPAVGRARPVGVPGVSDCASRSSTGSR